MMKKLLLCLVLCILTSCTGTSSTSLPAEQGGAFASVMDIAPAIVRLGILNEEYLTVGGCSGTIVDPRGLILTNFHCVGDTQTGERSNPDGLLEVFLTTDYATPPKMSYYAQLVESDRDADVAVLQIVRLANGRTPAECLSLPTVTINSAPVAIEAAVRAVGYPGFGGETLTVTSGTVAGIKTYGEASAQRPGRHVAIKMTAPVGHGNSGGALVNDKNELVGIPFYLYQDELGSTGQMYYAVAASEATEHIAAAAERPFPGCDAAPPVVLTREIASFPRSAVYGKLTYYPQSGQPFDVSEATIYVFGPLFDVNNLNLADVQSALARIETETDGSFAIPLTRDQFQNSLGVVVVYQGRIVVRENGVLLPDQESALEDYDRQRQFAYGIDTITLYSSFTAVDY